MKAKTLFYFFLLSLCLTVPLKVYANKYESVDDNSIQSDVQAIVLRVIDGDSIVVEIPDFPPIIGHNITVRVAGCDTAELKSKSKGCKDKAYLAKKFTENFAAVGQKVWLRDIKRDKYFRLIANVEVTGQDLTTLLIENELAIPYMGGKKVNDWCENN